MTVIITAYNEETGDRPADREPARARLPAGQAPSSSSRRTRSSDRTEEIALQYPEVTVISNPRGGKVAAQDAAVRQSDSEIVAFSDANATWSRRCAAQARARVRGSRGRIRLRPPEHPRRRRLQQGRRLLALRDGAARRRVDARLGHRRQRVDLRGAARGLRRGRSALRSRPLAAVPDGAARPARGLRARRRTRGRSRRRRTRPSTAARCGCSSTAG